MSLYKGISFELPNGYGSYLKDIFQPINVLDFDWDITNIEAYASSDSSHVNDLFPPNKEHIQGSKLQEIIETKQAYLIFVELRAFQGPITSHPKTYKEFMASDCQLILLLADSIYTTIYCKDQQMLHSLYENARNLGFQKLVYLSEQNDSRNRLSVW